MITVKVKLTQSEIEEAILHWLKNKHGETPIKKTGKFEIKNFGINSKIEFEIEVKEQ